MKKLIITSCNNNVSTTEEKKPEIPDIKGRYTYSLNYFAVYSYEEFDYYYEAKLFCYIVDNVDLLLSKNNIKLYESNKNKREWNALQYTLDYYKVDSKYKCEKDTLYYLLSETYYYLNEEKKEYFNEFMAIVQKDDKYIIIVK